MAVVSVHGPLHKLANNCAELEIAGATVEELLRGLEHKYPAVTGWILDERGAVRRHINVFVNGERVGQGAAVAATDRVEVLPAITGGT